MAEIKYENIASLPTDETVKALLPVFCERAAKEFPGLRKIYLYGSQARGDWNEDSDVDLFVVIDKEKERGCLEPILCRVSGVASGLELEHPELGCHLFMPIWQPKDLTEFTDEDFRTRINFAFVDNLLREGVIIYG